MTQTDLTPRAMKLLGSHREIIHRRTDRLFAALLLVEWLAGISVSLWISPLTWAGKESSVHPHVWVALGLGFLITVFPVALALARPGSVVTRHSIAVGQMLWSALLIHLTGGRIETHFHVFGSLAFLAFYRDWTVLLTATVVVALDHFLRGLIWPESVYGIIIRSEWRWLEHAGWVLFEDAFLIPSCLRAAREMRQVAERQAETEALGERRYETLVNSVDGIVWEADPAFDRVTFISPQVVKLLGYPMRDWTEREGFWKSRIDGQDRHRILDWLSSHAWVEGPYELEYRLVAQNGSRIWVRDSGMVIWSDGKPALRRGILTDISRIKAQEDVIRTSEERFRRVVEQAADGFFVHDLDGRLVDVNDEACRGLGYPREELLSKSMAELVSESDAEGLSKCWKALEPGQSRTLEATQRRKDGTGFPVEVKLGLIECEGRNLVLAMARDLSERQKLDQMKNEFVSTVSHELRTPLTSIRGSLGLVSNGVTGPIAPKAKAMIDIAAKNCDRLVTLVNDILDIEKVNCGKLVFKMRAVQVDSLLAQVIESNRPFAESLGVPLKFVPESSSTMVVADADRLSQVATNLISNACKFSPRGEAVTVSMRRVGDKVRVAVSDRGPGIAPEFRPRVFQKFAQAESSDNSQKKGTGLGLAISKAFIERMGGTIGFESTPGRGATFFFELDEKKRELAPAEPGSNRPRILICEDERDIALILRSTLDHQGFDSDIASTIQEARTLLRERRYTGLTLDLVLPDGSAVPFVRELRKDPATSNLPIIVVSAYLDDGQKELGGQAFGIVDWIEKPISPNRLQQALKVIHKDGDGKTPRILHVEDDADIRQIVQGLLHGTAAVDQAATVREAWEKLKTQDYDLMMLDMSLPDGSGLELLPSLRKSTGTPLPCLIFSAHEVSARTSRYVSAALLKSKTSNEELLKKIRSLLVDPVLARTASEKGVEVLR
jgi:PAS domain S-box-containing protein